MMDQKLRTLREQNPDKHPKVTGGDEGCWPTSMSLAFDEEDPLSLRIMSNVLQNMAKIADVFRYWEDAE